MRFNPISRFFCFWDETTSQSLPHDYRSVVVILFAVYSQEFNDDIVRIIYNCIFNARLVLIPQICWIDRVFILLSLGREKGLHCSPGTTIPRINCPGVVHISVTESPMEMHGLISDALSMES